MEQDLIDAMRLALTEGGMPNYMILPMPKGYGRYWNPQKQKWCVSTRKKRNPKRNRWS